MNSWEIIKIELTSKSRPGSMGYYSDLNKCADLFTKLVENLTDKEAAIVAMNADKECTEAILMRGQLTNLGFIK